MKIKIKEVKILINVIDLDLIREYTWCWNSRGRLQCKSGKYRGKYLHCIIAERMGLNPDKWVFRKNKNHLDFRRVNLIDFSLTQKSIRKNVLINEKNTGLIERYNWYFNGGYLRAWIDNKHQFLHYLIAERMGLDISNEIDHIDGNRENNYESNLREATHSQNQANCKKYRNNTSGYKGVYWHKRGKKWYACISFEGKQMHLGCFDDIIEAARTYDKAAIKYFGEFACLNFPRGDYE